MAIMTQIMDPMHDGHASRRSDPVPSFLKQSASPNNSTKLITAVDFPVTNTYHSSSPLRRHVSLALISVGCSLTSRNSDGRSRPRYLRPQISCGLTTRRETMNNSNNQKVVGVVNNVFEGRGVGAAIGVQEG
nr:transcription repressor OFP7-like isoform X1 [Ipomoea batatas]